MNKFKKPYGNRTSGNRPEAGARPGSRPRFGASAAARPRTTSPRDARSYRFARAGETFQKFDAVCSNCGKACQVPFRPDGVKPVYCKDCFGAPREALASKAGKKKFSVSPAASFNSLPATGGLTGGKSLADLTRQIAAMNNKIDTMLKILTDGGTEEE